MSFYRKPKFWISVAGALAAGGALSATQADTVMQVIQTIFGG